MQDSLMCHVEEGKIEDQYLDDGFTVKIDSDKNHFNTNKMMPKEYYILATSDQNEDDRQRTHSDEDEDSSLRRLSRNRATGIISPNFAGCGGTRN